MEQANQAADMKLCFPHKQEAKDSPLIPGIAGQINCFYL